MVRSAQALPETHVEVRGQSKWGLKRERRVRGWWNGERKSLDSDLWPHVFLFSFALLFAPYVSFLILLTDSLCPALIWPQAVISVTFPEVSWRPWRQRGQSAASVHLSVNIRSDFGQHQWCVQEPEATKMVRLVGIIKGQVLCFSVWDYTFVSYFWTKLSGFEIISVAWFESDFISNVQLESLKKLSMLRKARLFLYIVSLESIQIAILKLTSRSTSARRSSAGQLQAIFSKQQQQIDSVA